MFAVGLAGVFAAHTVGAWGPVPDGLAADAMFDWVAVQAITGDGTPHDPLHELFQYQGYSTPVELHPHPRTPGALLLQTPMLLVQEDQARPLMTVVSVAALVVLWWVVVRLTGLDPLWVAAGAAALTLTAPVRVGFAVGAQSLAVAAFIGLAWVWLRENGDTSGGVALAVAATLKLFPGLLVVLLWRNHRRAAYWALGATAAVNLAGLLLPDVTIAGTVEAFRQTQEVTLGSSHNMGLGLPLWATTVGVILVVWLARNLTLDWLIVAGSAAMVALTPVVWNHYLVVLFVPLVVGVSTLRGFPRQERRHRRSAVVADKEPDSGWATSQKRSTS